MHRRARRVALGVAVVLATAACSGGGDADVAVRNLLDLGLTADQATCVVDAFGEDRLAEVDRFSPEFEPAPQDEAALSADIRDAFADCAPDGEVPRGPSPTPVDCAEVDGPCERGDDPDLDRLWDDCADGDGAACDQLFFESPLGSRYEQFANTCGDRGAEPSCEEVHGGGNDSG